MSTQLPMLTPPPELAEPVDPTLGPIFWLILIGTAATTAIAVVVFVMDSRRNRK